MFKERDDFGQANEYITSDWAVNNFVDFSLSPAIDFLAGDEGFAGTAPIGEFFELRRTWSQAGESLEVSASIEDGIDPEDSDDFEYKIPGRYLYITIALGEICTGDLSDALIKQAVETMEGEMRSSGDGTLDRVFLTDEVKAWSLKQYYFSTHPEETFDCYPKFIVQDSLANEIWCDTDCAEYDYSDNQTDMNYIFEELTGSLVMPTNVDLQRITRALIEVGVPDFLLDWQSRT